MNDRGAIFGALGLAGALACGAPVASTAQARFPTPARVSCQETTTEGGVTTTQRTEERCVVAGERVLCRQVIEGQPDAGVGEERIDAAGTWTVGNEAYRLEPPGLSFPSDIAPGRKWEARGDMVMKSDGARFPFVKTFTVEAASQCEQGLVIKSTRQVLTAGAARVDNELVVCPGMSTPREFRSTTTNDSGVVRTSVGTCTRLE